MQVAVDNLVPFPVVVDRLHCQGDEDQSPKTEMEIGKANIGGADADDAEEDEAEGIGQLVHGADKARRAAVTVQ